MGRTVTDNPLLQFGEFFVEMGESGFEGFAMIGVRGRFEVIENAGAR